MNSGRICLTTFWNLELKRDNGVGICGFGCDQNGDGDPSRESIVSLEGEGLSLRLSSNTISFLKNTSYRIAFIVCGLGYEYSTRIYSAPITHPAFQQQLDT